MMTDYKAIDKLSGYSIEPGDLVELPNGEVITVIRTDATADGYDVFYLDLFEDEELVYSLPDNEFVTLLQFD
jgi:hypothetical protein